MHIDEQVQLQLNNYHIATHVLKVPEWIFKIHIYFQVTVRSVPALHAHPEGAGVTPTGGECKDGKHLEKRDRFTFMHLAGTFIQSD